MVLQTLIVTITVGLAAAFVVRTFTRQFTARDRKGCASCSHGGAIGQPGAGVPDDCSPMPEGRKVSRSASRSSATAKLGASTVRWSAPARSGLSASHPRARELVDDGSGDGLRAVHVEERQGPPKASPTCGMKRAPQFAIPT